MKKEIAAICAAYLLVSCATTVDNSQLIGNWIEIVPSAPELVQGMTLTADGSASSIGMATLKYQRWQSTSDSQLILWGESIGNGQTIDFSDTLKIIRVTTDSLFLESAGGYQSRYFKVSDPDHVRPFAVVDSLKVRAELGDLIERTFVGLLPAASCPGIEYTLLLYNQQNSGDGVYKLTQRYLEAENGKDYTATSYGRQYTLRGDAVNPDAVVLELIPFSTPLETINLLLLKNGDLELLNSKFERADSKLNYTLKLQ